MACAKEARVRTTDDTRPLSDNQIDGWYEHVRCDGTGHNRKYFKNSGITESYHKSILDWPCRIQSDDGTNPCSGKTPEECKKTCADCVKQSRLNFNAVRSVTEKLVTGFTAQSYSLGCHQTSSPNDGFRCSNLPLASNVRLSDAQSYEQWPALAPTGLELSDALRSITPSVEKFFPTVQLYEILFELRELKKLRNLFTAQSAVVDFPNRWLGFNFGYVPLISTITDIIEILITLDNVIDKWNDFATSDRIMDFHGTLRSSEAEGSYETPRKPIDGYAQIEGWSSVRYSFKDDYRVHLYIQPHIIPGDMRFRVLLKALGIDKPLSGFWELVPFSWLVDYFVNIGDLINDWETGLASMFKFDVTNVGYSIKRDMSCLAVAHQILGDHSQIDSETMTHNTSHFERVPLPVNVLRDAIIPTSWDWSSRPGGQQLTYILAVTTNVRRLPGMSRR